MKDRTTLGEGPFNSGKTACDCRAETVCLCGATEGIEVTKDVQAILLQF